MDMYKKEGDNFIKVTPEELAAATQDTRDEATKNAAEFQAFSDEFSKRAFEIAEKRGISTFAAMKHVVLADRQMGDRFVANLFVKP